MNVRLRLSRSAELAVKATHAGLRELGKAPEQRDARVLAASVAAAAPTSPSDGPKVLFLTPRSWAAHVQWEAVIAQSLRLRGASVRFLTCGGGLDVCDRSNVWESPPPPCRTCAKYVDDSLRAHGFDPTPLARRWSDGIAWPELDSMSIDELTEVVHADLPLGALVEIPVKWFLLRADLDGDPLAARTYRQFLRSARAVVDALAAELDRDRPETAVLCNGLFLFEILAAELCRRRGIDIVTYERGLIKETLLFRRNAIACLMDMTPFWTDWKDRPLTPPEDEELDAYLDERRYGRRSIDRYWDDAVFEDRSRVGARRHVTVLPNLTWDSAVIGQSATYDRLETWLVETIERLAAHPDVDVTIRVHPAETKLPGKQTREPVREVIDRHFPTLPANVTVVGSEDPTSSYSILEATDLVLVFSSTTGLESALMGKPVIVCGNTHYRGKGFTIDPSDPADYLATLDSVLADPDGHRPPVELARRYAHLLFFRAPVQSPGAEEHVLGLTRLVSTDAATLLPGADASLDRICTGILDGVDFGPHRLP